MQQEAACVLLGSYLVCFHLLKLQQIFTFRHQLLHLSLFPNTTSTDLHSSLSLALISNCLQFKFYQENIVCIVNSQINFRYISAACDVSSYRELDETSFKTEDGETPCPRSGLLLLLCPLFSLCHLTLSATVSEIHSLQSTVQRELVTIPAAYCTIQTWSDPIER